MAEPSPGVAEVAPPAGGLWRVGRADAPLASSRAGAELLGLPRAGNRFDTVDHGTVYFASSLQACYGETLARHRPKPELAALVADEWQRLHHFPPALLPSDWRARRVAVHVSGVEGSRGRRFLNVEAPQTHQVLRLALAPELGELGYADLDVAAVRGPDRRLTRLIAGWARQQRDSAGGSRFAGLRYLSRLNNEWECWAIFDDLALIEPVERHIHVDDPELLAVCRLFGLGLR